MVAKHLAELDDGHGDSAWQKKAIQESAATALGGEQMCFSVNLSG